MNKERAYYGENKETKSNSNTNSHYKFIFVNHNFHNTLTNMFLLEKVV